MSILTSGSVTSYQRRFIYITHITAPGNCHEGRFNKTNKQKPNIFASDISPIISLDGTIEAKVFAGKV